MRFDVDSLARSWVLSALLWFRRKVLRLRLYSVLRWSCARCEMAVKSRRHGGLTLRTLERVRNLPRVAFDATKTALPRHRQRVPFEALRAKYVPAQPP